MTKVNVRAIATLSTSSNPNIGSVSLTQEVAAGGSSGPVTVEANVTGLNEGHHLLVICAFGDINDDFRNCGPLFDLSSSNEPTGYLGILSISAEGDGRFSLETSKVTLTGPKSIIGRSIVIIQLPNDTDDQKDNVSKIQSWDGRREAGGVIGIAKMESANLGAEKS